jgi:NADP-dependent 3-hydroxy acid dehydrogenase YdfG
MENPLKDKVVIITGASSGFGASIAIQLAKAGARVSLAARRQNRLEEVKAAIEKSGGEAIIHNCDVTNRKSVGEMVEQTEKLLGPVDILVNNAGVLYYGFMEKAQEDEWNHQVDVNIKGVLNCLGAVLSGMVERKRGHIINMSSDAGRRGFPGLAVYAGTKFFVEGLSQSMRHELAKKGVKITCIQPGDAETELQDHSTDIEARKTYDPSYLNSKNRAKVMEADDIARAVLYAASQPYDLAVNEILIEPRESPL